MTTTDTSMKISNYSAKDFFSHFHVCCLRQFASAFIVGEPSTGTGVGNGLREP